MNEVNADERFRKNHTPVISVAMPVYNGEKYLAAAIDSILAQTYTDFELIIIDDGSTDNSLQVLKEYQRHDARIRLIARQNKNLVTTLNDIISLARGKWIARMDQDDIALPLRFERQLDSLEKTGADLCGSWVRFFGTADKRIIKYPQSDEAIKMALLFGSPFAHPTVMMRNELVKNLHYDKAWEKCEDYDLWERAARADWIMSNVPEVLLLYRQHAAQISSITATPQQEHAQTIRSRYWNHVFKSRGFPDKWIVEVLKIREPTSPPPNMDYVDAAFTALLRSSQGESRQTIFDHATRLYYRVAATCPDTVTRWSRLNQEFGSGYATGIKLRLWLLSTLHIRSNSRLFNHLKTIYFRLIRSI